MPIINLIQHVWHAVPERPARAPHASCRTRRSGSASSPEIEQAITRTGRVRGPVFTIPDATRPGRASRAMARHAGARHRRAGARPTSSRSWAARVAARLRPAGHGRSSSSTQRIPRGELVGLMGRARVTVFVPEPEGGLLPARARGHGGRAPWSCARTASATAPSAWPGENCFRPAYDEDAIVAAAETALRDGAGAGRAARRGRSPRRRDTTSPASAPRSSRSSTASTSSGRQHRAARPALPSSRWTRSSSAARSPTST